MDRRNSGMQMIFFLLLFNRCIINDSEWKECGREVSAKNSTGSTVASAIQVKKMIESTSRKRKVSKDESDSEEDCVK